jgi:hypothetical protein
MVRIRWQERTEEEKMGNVFVKSAVGSLVITGLFLMAGGTVGAAGTTLPPGTRVTVTGHDLTFTSRVDSVPLTVTCQSFTANGKIRSKPAYGFDLSAPPSFSGCSDSLGGTDIITTNDTNGSWTYSVNKAGTSVTLTIPKAGATFESRYQGGCVITWAPTKPAPVSGTYNGSNTVTVSAASFPTNGTGCASTAFKTSSTVVLSPAPGEPPWG